MLVGKIQLSTFCVAGRRNLDVQRSPTMEEWQLDSETKRLFCCPYGLNKPGK